MPKRSFSLIDTANEKTIPAIMTPATKEKLTNEEIPATIREKKKKQFSHSSFEIDFLMLELEKKMLKTKTDFELKSLERV